MSFPSPFIVRQNSFPLLVCSVCFIDGSRNENPGSLMGDATMPLNDSDEADMAYGEDEQ